MTASPDTRLSCGRPRGGEDIIVPGVGLGTGGHPADYSAGELARVLLYAQERILRMADRSNYQVVYPLFTFDYGVDAGAAYPRWRLVRWPGVPRDIESMALRVHKGECVVCEEMRRERASGERIVIDENGCVAWTPHAPRVDYEIRCAPARHFARFETTPKDALVSFSRVFHEVFVRMRRVTYNDASVSAVLYAAPWLRTSPPSNYDKLHWFFALYPRFRGAMNGVSLATGVAMFVVKPEAAAKKYRASYSTE